MTYASLKHESLRGGGGGSGGMPSENVSFSKIDSKATLNSNLCS